MAYKVFLGYAHDDQDLAADLRARLEQVVPDIRVMNPELKPGEWSAALRASLEEADVVLVLLTATSLESQWVLLEVGAALSLRKRIVPIVVGLDATQLPSWVENDQYVKYSDLNTYLLELAQQAKGQESAPTQRHPAKAGVS
jgi:hypothetical protein